MPDPEKILLITLMDPDAPPGGRELLCRLNARALKILFGESLTVHRLTKRSVAGLIDTMRGHPGEADRLETARILARIGDVSAGQVFVDGSSLGHLVPPIKRAFPDVRVVTFFHNVEARFFLGAVRAKRTVLSLRLLAANYAAERNAVRHSDAIICLSARDSEGLSRVYGRGADYISPIAVEDALPSPRPGPLSRSEHYLLFVGGAFYANRRGIEWFLREVAPRSPLPTMIVGQGMEALSGEFGASPNIRIVGAVDDLAHCYAGACCVVAPIFEGSGMKTKVAEALMFGKRIIGTSEAFSGYGPAVAAAGWRAEDANGFLAAIRDAAGADLPAFDPASRALYDASHSFAAAMNRMATIMLPASDRPRVAAETMVRGMTTPVS
ncbi:glycosyltransferase family 4 protein [Sphingomonas sp. QA11]|uniref:glycosyltransferase n=1 Tax=Sphingomonas sp. QA11 TaxID=2950605 RepID=UPI0023495251|nr:glycosyltransferase family 4 protein [Sphingomonas sp. QA11]WCM25245.1 glycosyltransferase family 4 protein [Sphingomonas sp. QA11]